MVAMFGARMANELEKHLCANVRFNLDWLGWIKSIENQTEIVQVFVFQFSF